MRPHEIGRQGILDGCVHILGGTCGKGVKKQDRPEWKQRDQLGVQKALMVDQIYRMVS